MTEKQEKGVETKKGEGDGGAAGRGVGLGEADKAGEGLAEGSARIRASQGPILGCPWLPGRKEASGEQREVSWCSP